MIQKVYFEISQTLGESVRSNRLRESAQLDDSFVNRIALSRVAYQRGLTNIQNVTNIVLYHFVFRIGLKTPH